MVSLRDMPRGLFEGLLNHYLEAFQDFSPAPHISNFDLQVSRLLQCKSYTTMFQPLTITTSFISGPHHAEECGLIILEELGRG